MPRYDYQCDDCGEVREFVFRMAEKPDTVACSCGGSCSSVISDRIEVLICGNEKKYALDALSVPVGWERGNTDAEAQERRYAKIINESRKQAKAVEKQAAKRGMRLIARQPREHYRMRTKQFGKDYYQSDVKRKLKEDGLLFGN